MKTYDCESERLTFELETLADWIFNFLIVLVTPVAFQNIGWKTCRSKEFLSIIPETEMMDDSKLWSFQLLDIIFAAINFVIVPSVYFFFPETACRSLEEIDQIFAKSGWTDVVHNARPSVTPLESSGMVKDVENRSASVSEKEVDKAEMEQ